jgi:hypothetical protein
VNSGGWACASQAGAASSNVSATVSVVDLTVDDSQPVETIDDDDCVIVEMRADGSGGGGARGRPALSRAETRAEKRQKARSIAAAAEAEAARPVLNCVVCMEDITQPWSTPCGHLFCRPCIVDTLQVSHDAAVRCHRVATSNVLVVRAQQRLLPHSLPLRARGGLSLYHTLQARQQLLRR